MQTVLVTTHHLFVGEVENSGRRLLDLLLDPNSRFLSIRQARVLQPQGENPVAQAGDGVVAKQEVSLAVIPTSEHEASSIRYFARVQRITREVFVTVGGYAVWGTLHMVADRELRALLTTDLGNFFPLTRATVLDPHGQKFEAPVVMVNQNHLAYMQLVPPRIQRPEISEQAPEVGGQRAEVAT